MAEKFVNQVDLHQNDLNGPFVIRLNAQNGTIQVKDNSDKQAFLVDGNNAVLRIGVTGNEGDIRVRDGQGRDVFNMNGSTAVLQIGANGNEGDIRVKDAEGRDVFNMDGNSALLQIGASGNEGDIRVKDAEGRDVFEMDGNFAVLRIGAKGNEGDLIVRDGEGREVFHMDGNFAVLRIGANGNEGDLIIRDSKGAETIHLNGETGDILLNNADFAEDFDILENVEALPGHIMVLGKNGKLQPCNKAYDKRAVGVISGAGTYRPGIIMDKQVGAENRLPIAMMGKVFCMVDADQEPIAIGDLLTTSPSFGHAMKVQSFEKGFGAVIGKALQPLQNGKGLIPILVSLQ